VNTGSLPAERINDPVTRWRLSMVDRPNKKRCRADARACLAGIVLALLAGQAQADFFDQTSGYANLGTSLFEEKSTLNSVTGRLGARFSPYLAAEGEFNLGLNQYSFASNRICPVGYACTANVFVKKVRLQTAEDAYLIGRLPLSDNADLFVRGGYGASQYSGFSRDSANLGAGAQYFFSGPNGVRFDYTRRAFTNDPHRGFTGWKSGQDVFSLAFVRTF
jgi:outer membrane immunogenic protein